ncbi:DUF4394 domain-containing protein [Hymenobacter arizonensis]|uniref:DUF4394 domain-containing protein n=1 Tax=Hymenobacter arizonensis TaxID=1227077 RepID=A0A1I5Z7D9_HYMAR|nr:DUF4394 domain-containing protein [Hymenobacter arizonensis]SFQ52265.1 protein of unknown function [Hymenobacter arizonensis]
MKRTPSFLQLAAGAALLFSMASCEKALDEVSQNNPAADTGSLDARKPKLDFSFYALAGGVRLDAFAGANPEKEVSSVAITGLQPGETILAIDFRPATGQLYGLGSTSRIYVIDPMTGAARAIGAGPFAPALAGTVAGFDFNPTVDRIRVVTSEGQNLRLNPETGTVQVVDGPVVGARIAAAAYTNNVAGAATTTLYDIDVASQKLFKQDPPNAGTLVEVGDLKLKVTGEGGFDIAPGSNLALALFEVNKKPTLFTVDLATGDTRVLAKYDKNLPYTGIAIPTNPVAYAINPANQLLIFDPSAPGTTVAKPITGLEAGESVVGLDFRPVNGQLYAVGSNSRLYTLNASSGAATLAAPLSVALAGTSFGVDFNPTVDRLRVVSNTGQNLRINPMTGAVTVDGPLNPGAPTVTGAAYTNNVATATTTALYDIDVATDKLFLQSPPNDGTLREVGPLGVNVDAANGFDIGGTSGVAYALLTSAGRTQLYRINIATGAATALGAFGGPATGFTIGLGF